MSVVRDKGREIINFYGGVVVRDSGMSVSSPSGTYYENLGILELHGPVLGIQDGRNLRCSSAKIYEKERIFKGYGGCEVESEVEFLSCDSVHLQEDEVLAFGNVFFKSEKDSVEGRGQEVKLKKGFAEVRDNSELKLFTSSDTITVNSNYYVYKDSILTTKGNSKVYSSSFEGGGDSLVYYRALRYVEVFGMGWVKDKNNEIHAEEIRIYLSTENKVDSLIASSNPSLKNFGEKETLSVEADSLFFYSFATDSLKYFRAIRVNGNLEEVKEDGDTESK